MFFFTAKERRFFIIAAALITAGGLMRILGWQLESPVLVADQGPVNINRVSGEELQHLPGIGPVLAKRIIDYRQANGNFTCAQDLDKVKGLGPKVVARLKDKVTTDGEN
jgi:competence ComEA-like helix-hairpin-helix protein